MKRLVDEDDPNDEVVRLLIRAAANHHPPPSGKMRLIAALGVGSAIGLSASNVLAWLGTSSGKVALAVTVVGAAAGGTYLATAREVPEARVAQVSAKAAPTPPRAPALLETPALLGAPAMRDSTAVPDVTATPDVAATPDVTVMTSALAAPAAATVPAPRAPGQAGEPDVVADAPGSASLAFAPERESPRVGRAQRTHRQRARLPRGRAARGSGRARELAAPRAADADPASSDASPITDVSSAHAASAAVAAASEAERGPARLTEETTWVDRLRVAAESHDRATFERLRREHRERFPDGQLYPEVDRLRALLQ